MCTLSLFVLQNQFIMTMNRDEARTRNESRCIKKINFIDTIAYHPVDETSGGTWVGFNNKGITLALLNRYHQTHYKNTLSRGLIIPELLAHNNLDDINKNLQKLLLNNYNPFDLICSDSIQTVKFSWDGKCLKKYCINNKQPFMLSSSSVSTDEILAKRAKIFSDFTKDHDPYHADEILKNLHLQHYTSDPGSSIFMSRKETHTKSISQIIITNQQLNYYYFDQIHLKNATVNYKQCHHKILKLKS